MLDTYNYTSGQRIQFVLVRFFIFMIPLWFLSLEVTKILAPMLYPKAFTKAATLLSLGMAPMGVTVWVFLVTLTVVHIICLLLLMWYVHQTMQIEVTVSEDKIVRKKGSNTQFLLVEDIEGYAIQGKWMYLVRVGSPHDLAIPKSLVEQHGKLENWIKSRYKEVTPVRRTGL